jgi:small subunit ribosomal protein S2
MKIPTVEKMAEAGLHFGHREGKWHPTMKKYIYGSKKGVHIIDLEKTREKLEQALDRVKQAGEKNENVLLVGTKVRVGDLVEEVGQDTGVYYINYKWLGGMLTNFDTIKKNIDRLKKMEEDLEQGDLEHYTKREQNEMKDEVEEMNRVYGGIREMSKAPDLVVVMDARIDALAVREARKLDIPVVALADTNVDISEIDYPIPGNDDAIKAVETIINLIGEAYQAGEEERKAGKKDRKEEKASSAKSTDNKKKKTKKSKTEKTKSKPKKETKKKKSKK